MPKQDINPHFDPEGIVAAVHQQDIGLRVTTNNVEAFRQIVYKAARNLQLPIHIYTYPRRPKSLALLKEAHRG